MDTDKLAGRMRDASKEDAVLIVLVALWAIRAK
jgi:hypothetical protein